MVAYSAHIAANRFGLGARPGDLEEIGSDGPDWLTDQLSSRQSSQISGEGLRTSKDNVLETFEKLQERRQGSRDRDNKTKKQNRKRDSMMERVGAYRAEVEARTRHAIVTAQPFRERLVQFWSNHFTVSMTKPQVANIAGSYEREAIRPHVTGRFAELLTAVVQHPAMLIYLDNLRSAGPKSAAGKRRDLGLNENLAREILELHTLGVNGGYTQNDVAAFAASLTGWTVPVRARFGGEPGTFYFQRFMHEPGRKAVLGKSYTEQGVEQGEAILRDLAAHPETAKFVATKLARHFIADDPPPQMIERISETFLETDGDLEAVATSLIMSPEAWRTPLAKFKSPNEFLISTLRSLGADGTASDNLLPSFTLLGQRPFGAPSPAGWPDREEDWTGPDAIKKRLEWATALTERIPILQSPSAVAASALGGSLSGRTAIAVERAASDAQGLVLFLMSPEFQRR